MEKTVTLEEALKRIEELEKENAELREELEYYRNRKLSGRQKHNAKWMAIYNDFVVGFESGMTMVEIAKRNLSTAVWRSPTPICPASTWSYPILPMSSVTQIR